ncbi:sulfate ABC transporter substrate-binding protein [Lacticaseibacillus sp. GG6-2]
MHTHRKEATLIHWFNDKHHLITLSLVIVILGAYGLFYHHQATAAGTQATTTITNASYDATREFYTAYDADFAKYWHKTTAKTVTVNVTNGGSGSQANAVTSGAQADVVSLALAQDVTSIQQAGLIKPGWQQEFPQNSSPYTSIIVFLVRKHNPNQITDWNDLTRPGIGIVTPNPKTSGAARWNYLAAWAYASQHDGNDRHETLAFMRKLYHNVQVLDSGSRQATSTFTKNHQGDVLLTWENEALAVLKKYPGQYELITPSLSIKCEPSVAVVDADAKAANTTAVAKAYVRYLYAKSSQVLAAKNGFRPSDRQVFKQYQSQFGKTRLVTVDKAFGGWGKAQKTHFEDGGTFDQIYQ